MRLAAALAVVVVVVALASVVMVKATNLPPPAPVTLAIEPLVSVSGDPDIVASAAVYLYSEVPIDLIEFFVKDPLGMDVPITKIFGGVLDLLKEDGTPAIKLISTASNIVIFDDNGETPNWATQDPPAPLLLLYLGLDLSTVVSTPIICIPDAQWYTDSSQGFNIQGGCSDSNDLGGALPSPPFTPFIYIIMAASSEPNIVEVLLSSSVPVSEVWLQVGLLLQDGQFQFTGGFLGSQAGLGVEFFGPGGVGTFGFGGVIAMGNGSQFIPPQPVPQVCNAYTEITTSIWY